MKKYSKQREAILNMLCGRKDHPTADMLYQDLKQEYPNLSLGTVYRNLSAAADEGNILRLQGADGVDHFDGTILDHYHIQCVSCHRVEDIPALIGISLDVYANSQCDYHVTGHSLMFYGVCSNCQDCQKENRNNS